MMDKERALEVAWPVWSVAKLLAHDAQVSEQRAADALLTAVRDDATVVVLDARWPDEPVP